MSNLAHDTPHNQQNQHHDEERPKATTTTTHQRRYFLGIETSFDDTAVGIVDETGGILAHVAVSQSKAHHAFVLIITHFIYFINLE